MKKPICLIKAINTPNSAVSLKADDVGGLENSIYLAVGASVFLTCNLNTSVGLTNMAKGVIKDIVYRNKTPNKDLPEFIVVYWPSYTGPQFFPGAEEKGA